MCCACLMQFVYTAITIAYTNGINTDSFSAVNVVKTITYHNNIIQ